VPYDLGQFVLSHDVMLCNGILCSLVIDGSDIVYRDYVDISCAVATPKVSCIE